MTKKKYNTDKDKQAWSRRQFLGTTGCAALGTTTFFSTMLNLGMVNTAAAASVSPFATNNYKAMVCILLAGGNDSFNMLVPRGDGEGEYGEYAGTRSNLALPQGEILPINPTNITDGRQFGVHPAMPEVQNLFNDGKLSFVANVGTLIEPVSINSYWDGSAQLPLGLYSHSDQIAHWQTSVPQSRSALGWGGRMADIMHEMNNNQNISMNISLSGTNVFQTGQDSFEYTIQNSGTGSIGIEGYGGAGFWDQLKTVGIDSMMEHHYQDMFKQTYAKINKNAINSHEQFSGAIANVSPFATQFAGDYFSQSMEMIAKTIAARQDLDMCRQTFYVVVGGWDHHDELLNAQGALLSMVSSGLGNFYSALEEINMTNDVTTFTISDFARTLTSNGNGTDHAWGGNQMVMGGAVNGQQIFGEYPRLDLEDSPLDTGNGVLIPTTSCDEYFSELANWFGVETGDLVDVFPNIGNFPILSLGLMDV